MKNLCVSFLCIFFCFGLSACGGSESESGDSQTSAMTSDASRFGDDLGKGCDLLTAKLVASTFDVPAASLKQMKIMGCHYSIDSDTEDFSASILSVRVHKTTGSAASWFANSTKSRSAEEMQVEMDKVAKRMEQREEIDTAVKKTLAKSLLNSIASKAVVYQDVANVGDEARSSEDGGLTVRVDNLTFKISAYSGPKQPRSELAGLDVKQMMAVSKKDAQEWEKKSAPQRTQDSAKLARAIIATL